ncbi:hypothetical protein [Streptomyces sp. NPDC047981]|uniref:hypothetical protein n=1 Tax=Streptomyces sp. NPDC047981 TaxID=3154610 RepID=UPI003431ACC3
MIVSDRNSQPSERKQNEELVAFVTGRLMHLGMGGPSEDLAHGVGDLLTTYRRILPHLDGAAPDYATGVADGLGQALRYIAAGYRHHPDYKPYFAPQAPATVAEWPA